MKKNSSKPTYLTFPPPSLSQISSPLSHTHTRPAPTVQVTMKSCWMRPLIKVASRGRTLWCFITQFMYTDSPRSSVRWKLGLMFWFDDCCHGSKMRMKEGRERSEKRDWTENYLSHTSLHLSLYISSAHTHARTHTHGGTAHPYTHTPINQ